MLLSNQKHGRQVEQPEHRVLRRAEDPSGGGRISNSPCFVGRSTGLGSYATWTKKGGWLDEEVRVASPTLQIIQVGWQFG